MASNYSITKFSDWDPTRENLEFKKPTKNTKGGLNINFTYANDRLYLKTPKMRTPFGMNEGMNPGDWSVQLCFDTDNEQALVFLEKCQKFDETMIELGVENAFDWNLSPTKSKKVSRDLVEDRYNRMVKYSKYKKDHPTHAGEVNPEYPPHFQVKLPQTPAREANPETGAPAQAAQFSTELYSSKKELLDVKPENIPRNSRCSVLMTGSGYGVSGKFGVSWKAAQLMVFPRGGLPTNQCLIDDPDDEEDFEEASEGDFQENTNLDEAVEQEEEAEAAEDEEEAVEEEVEEEEAEPVKVAPRARKTVAKK